MLALPPTLTIYSPLVESFLLQKPQLFGLLPLILMRQHYVHPARIMNDLKKKKNKGINVQFNIDRNISK